jgi:hypothetical protein
MLLESAIVTLLLTATLWTQCCLEVLPVLVEFAAAL